MADFGDISDGPFVGCWWWEEDDSITSDVDWERATTEAFGGSGVTGAEAGMVFPRGELWPRGDTSGLGVEAGGGAGLSSPPINLEIPRLNKLPSFQPELVRDLRAERGEEKKTKRMKGRQRSQQTEENERQQKKTNN